MSEANSSRTLPSMETLVTLCKRRGFIFQSSEIYGGYAGFFDYGPLGVELKNNVKQAWWKAMVHQREDVVGMDSSIIMHPEIWRASGHVGGFSDPMVDCKSSKKRYRADQLFYAPVVVDGEVIGYISIEECVDMESKAQEMALAMKRKMGKQGEMSPIQLREYTEAKPEEYALVPSPATGEVGVLTPPRQFNLMFETKVGPLADESAVSYLRPETAQGIFQCYRNIVDTGRVKIPFGIAQIGKAFRNEITPRNFIFRSREFEQMELEYFIDPDEETWPKMYRYWIDWSINWLQSIGIPADMIGEHVHPQEKLSHYSKGTTDLTFSFPFGVQELWGIACRGDFDLTQHQKHSGKSLEFFDEARKQKYIPHVIEPSLGVDRTVLAVLTAAYYEDEIEGEKRVVLRFHPKVAPYKVAVFPLVKNKPEIVEKAKTLFTRLQRRWTVAWDVSGAIGRRYRRQDEIGTPYAVTIDYDTIEKDNCVTIRERDSTNQVRIPYDEVESWLATNLDL